MTGIIHPMIAVRRGVQSVMIIIVEDHGRRVVVIVSANMVAHAVMWRPIGAIKYARTEEVHRPSVVIIAVSPRMVVNSLDVVPAIMRMPTMMAHITMPV